MKDTRRTVAEVVASFELFSQKMESVRASVQDFADAMTFAQLAKMAAEPEEAGFEVFDD
jgi:hypothetical protein